MPSKSLHEPPTSKQVNYLAMRMRVCDDYLPEAWRHEGPHEEADYRLANFETWCERNLTIGSASFIIAAFKVDDDEGGLEALRAAGCPIA
ncbi:MAG: hypothetical protein Q8Q08_12940 [Candidatus Omnitrophota bacterium]|nr:hypothetical protein [Candidatus Omnitrophota bacterium]